MLDQRHMLVSSRMINRVHRKSAHDAPAFLALQHRAEKRHQFRRAAQSVELQAQLLLDGIQRKLRHLQQNQPGGLVAQYLAAQLGSDGAPGTAHHHRLARNTCCDQSWVRLDLIAPKQILDLDLAHILQPHCTLAIDQISQRRRNLDLHF